MFVVHFKIESEHIFNILFGFQQQLQASIDGGIQVPVVNRSIKMKPIQFVFVELVVWRDKNAPEVLKTQRLIQ
jgi:hypothetical protein